MIKNYFVIAWRNLVKNKAYSLINIGGLAVGMAVAILIGLWIYDELNFDKYFKNYDRIVQVLQHQTYNGEVGTQNSNPAVLGQQIRQEYGSDFKYVLQSSWNFDHTLTVGEKMFLKPGSFFEPGVAEMLSLKMIHGTRDGLKDIHSILLSQSVAQTYFGNSNPVGKVIRFDDRDDLKVTGVYEDIPQNSSFRDLKFIVPWELYLAQNPWVQQMKSPWGSNFTQTFAQVAANADIATVSAKIKDIKLKQVSKEDARYKPEMFLQPMRKWHLYDHFNDAGVNDGGRIEQVWMFGVIGVFVLLLACINFMNLSTARSEKRAREVGIRKTIGSVRRQLVTQFFSEAILVSVISFLISLVLVQLMLPFFNNVAGKEISLLWSNPWFWILGFAFSVFTGLVAGCYPALYLSSFKPVKVLKGTFNAGRFAAVPRKILVVAQFSISIFLIIGTVVVYKQIQHAQNRPVGYSKQGLISISTSKNVHEHFETVRNELIKANAIEEMTEATSPTTEVWNSNGGFDWEGKDPNRAVDFPNCAVTPEFGKTIGWQVIAGRDFSRDFASDTAAFILNEAAAGFIGMKDPVGKILRWEGRPYTIVGIVKDMLVQSPYLPVRPSLYYVSKEQENVFILKISSSVSVKDALAKIETVFKKYNPSTPFLANFVDEQFAQKFGNEQRIGKLAAFFSILAIFISALGLFGLASYIAERRTKEIGIRKVLGASVSRIWSMLSKDFVLLVIISSVIAIPAGYYFMRHWLQQYDYRTNIPWWIFLVSGAGALIVTLFTVSFQAIKAALANPVKSLRSE